MAGDGDRGTGEPSLVRPYTLTAGRTDAQVELALEAAVVGHGDAAEPQRAASDETVRVDALPDPHASLSFRWARMRSASRSATIV